MRYINTSGYMETTAAALLLGQGSPSIVWTMPTATRDATGIVDLLPANILKVGGLGIERSSSLHHCGSMDASRAITIMSALAQPTRLKTYHLLVERGEEGLNSGAIAAEVGAPQNTMSSHLTILTHAGLVRRSQKGREVTYHAILEEVAALGAFLTRGPGMAVKSKVPVAV